MRTTEVNYFFSKQPQEALLMQEKQEYQLQNSAADPTQNLLSSTWVDQAANLIMLQERLPEHRDRASAAVESE